MCLLSLGPREQECVAMEVISKQMHGKKGAGRDLKELWEGPWCQGKHVQTFGLGPKTQKEERRAFTLFQSGLAELSVGSSEALPGVGVRGAFGKSKYIISLKDN